LGLLTTLGRNIGDDFIREGLVHVVRRLVPHRQLVIEAVNKHQPHTVYPRWHPIRLSFGREFRSRPKPGLLRRQLRRWLSPMGFSRFDACDLIIQCGAPVIWEGCADSEWAQMIWCDVLARLARRGTPVLNLGAGTCYPWERPPATLVGAPDEAFIRLMLDAARVTTARDRLMTLLCASLASETPQIPCPALLVGQTYVRPDKPTRKVLVNYMPGGGHYDWGQKIDASCWERTMVETIGSLRKQGWEPFLLAHDALELALAAKLWPDLPRSRPDGAREYFEAARGAMFGIFNRMHACVGVAGIGIPSVAIGTDTRNLMVEAIGLPAIYVKNATTEKLQEAVDWLCNTRDSVSRRLLDLRETTVTDYENRLRPFLAS
jgi:hypothetical protein